MSYNLNRATQRAIELLRAYAKDARDPYRYDDNANLEDQLHSLANRLAALASELDHALAPELDAERRRSPAGGDRLWRDR